MGRIAGWLLTLLCALAQPVAMAAPAPPGVEYTRFRTLSTRDGLPQVSARAITQDAAGFLWIGTQDGLARFDGYEFKVHRHDRDDPWSLSDSHVSALVANDDGSLWIATLVGGLNRYDPDLDRFTSWRADPARTDALASDNVGALLRTRSGRLWIASAAGRLQWFQPADSTFQDSGLGEHPAFRTVRRMLELPDGRLLLGTLDGLWHFDPATQRFGEIRVDPALPLDVYALALGPDQDLWIGTSGNGLHRLRADGAAVAHYQAGNGSLHDDAVRGLLFDRAGALWIAGDARGLARLDTASGAFEQFRHDPARDDDIASNRLWTLFEDRDGLLVVGSWTNGFSVHDPRTRAFGRVRNVPGDPRTLPTRTVPGLLANPDGTLWAGLGDGGGLVRIDPARGVLEHHAHDPLRSDSLGHDYVRNLARSRDGSLWIATSGGGLDRMLPDGSRFEHFRHQPGDPQSLSSDTLVGAFEDSQGTLWVYTLDRGVDERCAGCTGFRHHRHDPADPTSIGDNSVSQVMETRAGELWMGTRGGLQRYDRESGRFERFVARANDPDSLSSNSISTLLEDSRGELWIGTQGGGINRRIVEADGRSRFQAIDVGAGLAANAIGALYEDERGYIWASTTAGISRIDRNGAILNFGAQDGTQEGGYWLNSLARLPDGRVAFGGLDGFTLFDPDDVTAPPTPKPMVTGLLLRNVPVLPAWRDPASPIARSLLRGRSVTLAHDQDNVTFEFGALAFADPASVLYAYRLDPHDTRWIETPSTRRLATYTDLAPGTYALSVRARRAGGEWSDPTRVDIHVQTAPWASPAARAVYALALLALALLVGLRLRANLRVRRAHQEAIRLSEERLKLALWGSGSELWDADIATGSVHRENQLDHLEITHLAGDYSVADLRRSVHPDDLPRFERAMRDHLRGQASSFEASYRTLDRNGQWAWLLTRGRVVQRDDRGRALRMTGATSDITALNHALAALRALNEQLESRVEQRTAALQNANVELRTTLERLTQAQRHLFESEKLASLGGMVAGIAHEINTPLGIGVTAASHLREEAQRLLTLVRGGAVPDDVVGAFAATASESSDLILRNLQRADRLVRSFKRIAVDQSTEDRRVVDLGASLDEILTTLGPSLRKLPHRIEIDCPPGIVVETAPGALYQVITNLVMNSLVHAFAPGIAGSIVLRVRRGDGEIVLEYADNGRGMDEAVRARIYEPFYTTQRGQGGSGLGLHIVYTLVTQVLGGSIECESTPGQGTRFRIRFPERLPSASKTPDP